MDDQDVVWIPVDDLRFDAENPRLPQELIGADQSELFRFIAENEVIGELVESMLTNGFFVHEALLVLPPDEQGKYIVVEGNRRLAALMAIAQEGEVSEGFTSTPATDDQRERLSRAACHVIPDREEVRKLLGYRHISGLKPWKPESKSRYITQEVEAAVERGDDSPFYTVGRMLGGNSLGVRNSYQAFALLRVARNDCGINVGSVLADRFGVWLRCMNSPEIRGYVGFGSPRSFFETAEGLASISCEKLREVIEDLSPGPHQQKPLLADSRDVTDYGAILANSTARAVLREHRSLELARQVLGRETIPQRMENLRQQLQALERQIRDAGEPSTEEIVVGAAALVQAARFLEGAIKALGGV